MTVSHRKVALITGLGLLLMAIVAPFAHFGVLESLVVPGDATATASNIGASAGLWRAGIAAFLIVAMLDIVVAWGLYVLFRQVNETLALLVAWMRVVYAAVLLVAVANLFDTVALRDDAQVMASIASFENAWMIGLAIFGLHLLGLGFLVFGSSLWSRILGILVVVAGGGYVVDSFGTILVPDYGLTVSLVTFIGEPLLIVWLLWMAARGIPASLKYERPGDTAPVIVAGRA